MNPPILPSNVDRIFERLFANFQGVGAWGKSKIHPGAPAFSFTILFRVFPVPGFLNPEKGGVSLFLLCGLPVLLLAVALFSWRWSQLYDSKRLRGVCRSELQVGLQKAGDEIQALLKLNSRVRAHRMEKISAERALEAALLTLNPKVILPAKAWVQKVALQGKILRGLQLRHLSQGRWQLQRAQTRALRALRGESSHRGLAERKIEGLHSLNPLPQLAVQITDTGQELPEYELTPRFSERQKLELRWHSQFEERSSAWSLPRLRLPESCGQSLTPDLQVVASQDRFFWKH